MTSPTRIRVLTPEKLDAAAANLVNTAGSQLSTAVASKAGTSQGTAQGTSTAMANGLMQRDANARAQVAAPAVAADIATKGYVDGAVTGYVPVANVGAPSGVASLDGSGFVTAGQLPTYLGRQLGTTTSFPGSPRLGDVCLRSDVGINGSMWRWNGTKWIYADGGLLTFGTVAARDAFASPYDGLECEILGIGQFIYSSIMPGWQWLRTWNYVLIGDTSYNYGLSTTHTTLPGSSSSIWVPSGREFEMEFTGLGHTTSAIAHVQLNVLNGTSQGNTIGGPQGGDSWQAISIWGRTTGQNAAVTFAVSGWLQSGTEADVRSMPASAAGIGYRWRIH